MGVETEENQPTPGRRRELALLLLLILGGLGGGLALRHWTASKEPAAGPSASPFGSSFSAGAQSLWDRLVAVLGQGSRQQMTFERLSALLSRHRSDPVAAAFAAEFRSDPDLDAAFREYVHARDSLPPSWLLKRLSDSARFRQLLNRYSEDPRFVEMARALELDLAAAPPQPAADSVQPFLAAAPVPPAAANSSLAVRNSATAVGHAAPVVARKTAGGLEAQAAREPLAAAQGVPASPTEERSAPALGEGKAEHKVTPLDTIRATGDAEDLNPWASMCYAGDPAISREQCGAIKEHLGENGLWIACQKAQLLDKCVSLCRDKPALRCSGEAVALQECRERYSAAQCAEACTARPDCRIDPPPTVSGTPPDGNATPNTPEACRPGYKRMGARGCLPSCGMAGGRHCLAGKSCAESGGSVPVGVDTWDCGVASCCY